MSLDACDVNVNPRQMELRPHGTADFPAAMMQFTRLQRRKAALPGIGTKKRKYYM